MINKEKQQDPHFFAHSKPDRPLSEWQSLEDHLTNVAGMASRFASTFGAGEWGYLAGIWHDLGKYSHEFQRRIHQDGEQDSSSERIGRPDHSSAGAQHAQRVFGDPGKILAYPIAGHHAGIPDGKTNDRACLVERTAKEISDFSSAPKSIIEQCPPCGLPFSPDSRTAFFQISFFIRMLYSCLVDADFLDTESFLDPDKARWRSGYPKLTDLHGKLATALKHILSGSPQSTINKHRTEILRWCLHAAELKPGLFSLTVPTGGGKTLSSVAFAMKHAILNGMNRIIYVIPYTSIIEQNAEVFRSVLGEDAVLEHHSNYDPPDDDQRSRLASENWDAPLIVTTNVQFFESLFANRSSRCRKIHRIARSVVILDEAQMLPPQYLRPTIETIRELAKHYGTSILLCTATQPALSMSDSFKDGLDNVREIAPDPVRLYEAFRRVEAIRLPLTANIDLASRLDEHRQVLCIVNTRRQARELYQAVKRDGAYHLSALMCPAHRSKVLSKIRMLLSNGEPCRVVSTQLVEAGVDLDFPVVYRALTGIDSIAQAAGRCNREGRLVEKGRLYIFQPENAPPPGHLRQTADVAEEILRHQGDPLSLAAVREYFKTLYWVKGERLDEKRIMERLSEGKRDGNFPFREIAQDFQIIENGMVPLIIPWDSTAVSIIQRLRYSDFPASAARKAQKYTITVPSRLLAGLIAAHVVENIHDQYPVLINTDLYREDVGLCPDDPLFHKVESLIF